MPTSLLLLLPEGRFDTSIVNNSECYCCIARGPSHEGYQSRSTLIYRNIGLRLISDILLVLSRYLRCFGMIRYRSWPPVFRRSRGLCPILHGQEVPVFVYLHPMADISNCVDFDLVWIGRPFQPSTRSLVRCRYFLPYFSTVIQYAEIAPDENLNGVTKNRIDRWANSEN